MSGGFQMTPDGVQGRIHGEGGRAYASNEQYGHDTDDADRTNGTVEQWKLETVFISCKRWKLLSLRVVWFCQCFLEGGHVFFATIFDRQTEIKNLS